MSTKTPHAKTTRLQMDHSLGPPFHYSQSLPRNRHIDCSCLLWHKSLLITLCLYRTLSVCMEKITCSFYVFKNNHTKVRLVLLACQFLIKSSHSQLSSLTIRTQKTLTSSFWLPFSHLAYFKLFSLRRAAATRASSFRLLRRARAQMLAYCR